MVYDTFRADGGLARLNGNDDLNSPKIYDKVPFPVVPEPTITSPYILKMLA